MDIFVTFLLIALIFGLLVFVHELGHFLMAKKAGVVVEQFAFGFGPKVIAKKWHGTEYRINLIPMGGYVQMLGDQDGSSFARYSKKGYPKEDKDFVLKLLDQNKIDYEKDSYEKVMNFLKDQQESLAKEDGEKVGAFVAYDYIPNHPGNYDNQSLAEKLAIVVAGVTMNFFLGVFLFYVLFLTTGYKIELPKIGNPPLIGTEVASEFPILYNTYDQDKESLEPSLILAINGDDITNKEQIIEYISEENVELELELFSLVEARTIKENVVLNGDGIKSSFDSDVLDKIYVASIEEGSVADDAGIEEGAIITSLNGREISTIDELISIRDENKGKNIEITYVNDDGEVIEGELEIPNPDNGEVLLGTGLVQNEIAYFEDLMILNYEGSQYTSGFAHSVNITTVNFYGLGQLVAQSFEEKSIEPVSQGVGSIVAVADFTYTLVKISDFRSIFNLTATLSVVLAIMNMLPIPLLDGGHVVFILAEKFRGKPLSADMQERIGKISFFLLIGLTFVIMMKDILLFDWPSRFVNLFRDLLGL